MGRDERNQILPDPVLVTGGLNLTSLPLNLPTDFCQKAENELLPSSAIADDRLVKLFRGCKLIPNNPVTSDFR